MKEMYMLCGIPACGKSSWAKEHIAGFRTSVGYISRDDIRFSLLEPDDEYFAKEKQVYRTFIQKIKESLNTNEVTIVDATHLNIRSRAKLLYNLGTNLTGVKVNAVVLQEKLNVCIKRNETREGKYKVPCATIEQMYQSFSIPTFDEGFDKIYIRTTKNDYIHYRVLEKEGNN